MKALLFPGQGSQIVGMGYEFYNNFDYVKKLFDKADDILKFKISKIILEGPESDLKLTKNTQPAILLVSCSIFQIFKKEFGLNLNQYKYFAGHSLGEYSALVCAQSLDFKDALYLVHERGKEMQNAVPVGEGAMLAILGLKLEEVYDFIKKLKSKNICEVANDNAEGQTIVSGNVDSINELQILLKENKKKSIKLPVSAPFHCSLMKEASENMKKKIINTNFNIPTVEIINNVNAESEKNPENIKDLLVKQIYSKVRWRESIIYMMNKGINEFIEIGPGKVLTTMVKRIDKNLKTNSINTIEEIKNLT